MKIDGVPDSGVIEQLTEEKWCSPFPHVFKTTERPDRAAMAILEGRIVLLCDNSPVALILPTDYNSFIQTSDDYYNRFEIASLGRFLRYIASFYRDDTAGLISGGHGFPHADFADDPVIIVCGGKAGGSVPIDRGSALDGAVV